MKRQQLKWQSRGARPALLRERNRRVRRGAALLEFALVVPILLVMLIGIIEFAWMTKNQLSIANATREGARAASVGRSVTDIEARVRNMASGVPGATTSLSVTTMRDDASDANGYDYTIVVGGDTCSGETCRNNAPSGAMIKVSVSVPHTSLTNMFPGLNNRILRAEVVMRREG